MQGKIALEEHFARAATLADSQVFGALCGTNSGRGSLTFRISDCG
jgi:hypothetical protein